MRLIRRKEAFSSIISLHLMTFTSRPGQHLLSAAVSTASDLAAETGELPRLKDVAKRLRIERKTLKAVITDRDCLLGAMADVALQRLLHTIIHRIANCSSSSPVCQLEETAVAYIEWARLHSHEFRVIAKIPVELWEKNPHLRRYEQSIHDLVAKLLQRAQQDGYLDQDEDLAELRAMLHTYVFGIITKMMLGDLTRWSPGLSDQDAALTAIRLFIARLFKQVSTSPDTLPPAPEAPPKPER